MDLVLVPESFELASSSGGPLRIWELIFGTGPPALSCVLLHLGHGP